MSWKTAEEYIDSLRKLKPVVYIHGQREKNPVDHPIIMAAIKTIAKTYELRNDPKYKEYMRVKSHLTGEWINRYQHIIQSPEDIIKKAKMQRLLNQHVGACAMRCIQVDGLNVLSNLTHGIDQEHGTEYHARFNKYLEHIQETDLMCGIGATDPKGDRSLRPEQQKDPDAFLHVVKERPDGIIVRGAKLHQTGALTCHYMKIFPSHAMNETEKDYAIAFVTPVDAEGIIYIIGRHPMDARRNMGIDWATPYDIHEALVIYNDVFVPWERVLMYKEYEFTPVCISLLNRLHRHSYGGCGGGFSDIITGAAALVAEYNGVLHKSSIQHKLAEMVRLGEMMYSGAVAAGVDGEKMPSGAYAPNEIITNATKISCSMATYELIRYAQDIAGGLVVTMPSEKDFANPETGKWVDKYLRGVPSVPTESRMKVMRFIENLTLGVATAVRLHGGGSPQQQVIALSRAVDYASRQQLVKNIIGVKE